MACDPRSALAEFVLARSAHPVVVLGKDDVIVESNDAARRWADVDQLFAAPRSSAVRAFLDEVRRHGVASRALTATSGPFALEGRSVEEWVVVLVREAAHEDAREPESGPYRAAPALDMAMVLHDVNNILTPLLLLSSHLQSELEGSCAGETAREIFAAATLGASLVQDVLSRARPKSPSVRYVNVNDVVTERLGLIGQLLGSDVEVRAELGDGVGDVAADRARLEHALLNLVTNARDAMPDGGRLTIATQLVAQSDGAFVALSVRDTGNGMTHEVRRRAFDPFFSTKGTSGARGIGLASVQRFATENGGHVTLESAPRKGTTATLLLPRFAAAAKERA